MSKTALAESNRLEDANAKGELRRKFASFWECKIYHLKRGDKWFIWSGEFVLLGE